MNSKNGWTTVIFDLDGTLVDTLDLIVQSFQHAEREICNRDVAEQTALAWIGLPLRQVYRDYPDPEAMTQAYRSFNLSNLERLQRSFDGIEPLLKDLSAAGIKVGVATSKSREAAVRSVRAAGLEHLVELTTTMDETVLHKPHPEPIVHSRGRLDSFDEDCVYVGDAIWDVRAARAAGIDQIGVTWGSGTREDLAAETPSAGMVDTVDELRTLLLGAESVGANA